MGVRYRDYLKTKKKYKHTAQSGAARDYRDNQAVQERRKAIKRQQSRPPILRGQEVQGRLLDAW